MISGEWSILEKDNLAVVCAVNKRIYSSVSESKDNNIYLSLLDFNIRNIPAEIIEGKLVYLKELTDKQKEILKFTNSAVETVYAYLKKINPFKLETSGKETRININSESKKIGFGSSAASVVSIISSILKFNNFDIEKKESKELIYKLSAIAHYFAQGKSGSCFDIAASVFGGFLVYRTFYQDWFLSQFEQKRSIKDIVDSKWNGFYVKNAAIPKNLKLSIGFTGSSASTSEMIKKMKEFKSERESQYFEIINKIKILTEQLIFSLKTENENKILELIKENEKLLSLLGKKSNIKIETEKLKLLCEIADKNKGAGKLSGAGGGDCGIALCFSDEIKNKIESEWRKLGIYVISAEIDKEGIKEDASFKKRK